MKASLIAVLTALNYLAGGLALSLLPPQQQRRRNPAALSPTDVSPWSRQSSKQILSDILRRRPHQQDYRPSKGSQNGSRLYPESAGKRVRRDSQAEATLSRLPHVTVSVAYPTFIASIYVPLDPDMTTYSALTAAESRYRSKYPRESNPFNYRMERLEDIPCWGISSFGDERGEGGYRWHVRVTDRRTATVLHDSICLPRGSALKLRSHYAVEFYQQGTSR